MTKNNNNPEQPITDISVYIAALQTTYRPASAPADATAEVLDAIKDIDPSAKVSPTEIFEGLRQAGFNFCNRPGAHGLEFKWMFREI